MTPRYPLDLLIHAIIKSHQKDARKNQLHLAPIFHPQHHHAHRILVSDRRRKLPLLLWNPLTGRYSNPKDGHGKTLGYAFDTDQLIKAAQRQPRNHKEFLKEKIQSLIEIDEETQCWIFQGYTDRYGRGNIYIREYGKPRIVLLAHRAALHAFQGVPISDQNVHVRRNRKRCHEPSCCNPKHFLIFSDKKEADQYRARHRKPQRISSSKLGLIRKIKEELNDGFLSTQKIADLFGVSYSTVYAISIGRAWANVLPRLRKIHKPKRRKSTNPSPPPTPDVQ